MATNPIGNTGYADTYSLLQKAGSGTGAETTARTESTETQDSGWKTRIREQIESILADVPKGDDGKLSFQDVDDYRESLEKKWDIAVMADLEALGVDTDKELPLTWDPTTGRVTVTEGHPDKAVVDQYFDDNPDKIEEFQRIIQLGKMTNLSQSHFSASQLRQNIQQQSMAWWYEDNSDPTQWFSGGGSLLGSSFSSYTGLDIVV